MEGQTRLRGHLEHHHDTKVSPSTIWRHLAKAGLVTPAPKKRPRSSYVRFQADLPNECWQADFTHWRLADDTDTEILTWLDDHSRFVISSTAHRRVSGRIVVDRFMAATKTHGIPASSLTDNGMVFTTRLSGGKGGRNGYESALRTLGVHQKNSRPNHPTTCGKVERFQQSLKEMAFGQRCSRVHRTAPGPARRLRRRVQQPKTPSLTSIEGHASGALLSSTQGNTGLS